MPEAQVVDTMDGFAGSAMSSNTLSARSVIVTASGDEFVTETANVTLPPGSATCAGVASLVTTIVGRVLSLTNVQATDSPWVTLKPTVLVVRFSTTVFEPHEMSDSVQPVAAASVNE